MDNLEIKVGDIKNELVKIVDKRFTLPISPSNKKYLQVVDLNKSFPIFKCKLIYQ